MTTHYNGSRGPVLIASMVYSHLVNARNRLQREEPHRTDEIEAMTAEITKREEELAAADQADAPTPIPQDSASQATDVPVRAGPAPIGDNNPPEPTLFERVKAKIDDLLLEARNWADGAKIERQEQADTVARLMDQIRQAAKAADEARKAENEEFDKGKAAVQAKYAPLIADTKTQKGCAVLALDALKATLTPWLQQIEAAQKAEADRKREEAEQAALAAAEAARKAAPEDLVSQEQAQELANVAAAAFGQAKAAEQQKAHAHGGSRATGLRSYFTARLIDPKEALLHYLARRPDDVRTWLQEMAQADVTAGVRSIPGFIVDEDRRVA